MCLSVASHQTGPVHRQDYRQILNTDIVKNLVISPQRGFLPNGAPGGRPGPSALLLLHRDAAGKPGRVLPDLHQRGNPQNHPFQLLPYKFFLLTVHDILSSALNLFFLRFFLDIVYLPQAPLIMLDI